VAEPCVPGEAFTALQGSASAPALPSDSGSDPIGPEPALINDKVVRSFRVCTVIPAFNEGLMVANVVDMVRNAMPRATIVVVNDGSEDDTGARAAGAGAYVINLPINLGIGGAVQAGYRYAVRYGYDIAVQVDGDGQHDTDEIERLIQPIIDGHADITVGSRWLGRGQYVAPTARRSGMKLLAKLVNWRSKGSFTDTTSGFRAVSGRALEFFAKNYPTDFPEVESLVLALQHGFRIQEVPVRMTERIHGKSSIGGFRSAYYMTRVGLALIIGRLGPLNEKARMEI
jgi:glycosyltransferase involved in cell wall biosynthesis